MANLLLWLFFLIFQLHFGIGRAFAEQSGGSWSMLCDSVPSKATGEEQKQDNIVSAFIRNGNGAWQEKPLLSSVPLVGTGRNYTSLADI